MFKLPIIPRVIDKVFEPEVFKLVKARIEEIKQECYNDKESHDNAIFYRLNKHNDPFFKSLYPLVQPHVEVMASKKVKPSYVFNSMYFVGKGNCPIHKDRPQCKYTLDLCINQNEPWGIVVGGREYFLEENQALCYSGTDHWHYRLPIQPNNYCDLAFFHFVDLDFNGPLD
jgi:hypothetical protein